MRKTNRWTDRQMDGHMDKQKEVISQDTVQLMPSVQKLRYGLILFKQVNDQRIMQSDWK